MKKKGLIILLAVCIAFMMGCSSTDKADVPENVQEEAENNIIDFGIFRVIIPKGYTGTGGYDGVRYVNAILTPKDKSQKYEIEVGSTVAGTSNDYQGQMSVRGNYNNAVVAPVDTKGWKSPWEAYTFVRTDDRDSSALTNFNNSTGPSQVMGLFWDGMWLEAELRVKEGTISDYPDELYDFMAVAIDWQN